jgi:hypothetical protein
MKCISRALRKMGNILFAPLTVAVQIRQSTEQAEQCIADCKETINSHEYQLHMAQAKLDAIRAWQSKQMLNKALEAQR